MNDFEEEEFKLIDLQRKITNSDDFEILNLREPPPLDLARST